MKLSVDLYGVDTFTVLGRAHAIPSRMYVLHFSHHGRHKFQLISNPLPLDGACVESTFPPLSIVFDPYTHDND